MPFIIDPANGQERWIPGVYSRMRVDDDLPGPTPGFHVPVLLASAVEGVPYNVNSGATVHRSPFRWCGTSQEAARVYGPDSDVATVMKHAKKGGLPGAYVCSLSKLTRGSVTPTSGAGTVAEYTIRPRSWGAPANHIMIRSVGGTKLEIQPVKRYTMLTADAAATDTRIYVAAPGWLSTGRTYTLGDNATANVTVTVVRTGSHLDSDGRWVHWVDLDAAVGSAFTTANYAMILEYDLPIVSGTLATGADHIEWINQSSRNLLEAEETATFTGAAIDAIADWTALKDFDTEAESVWQRSAAVGTSPAATAQDVADWIALMDASEWDRFGMDYQTLPQCFYLGLPSSTAHHSLRDWAAAKRAEGHPVSVMSGNDWDETDLEAEDDANPLVRLRNLNSQDFALAIAGLDRLPAYLSFGAQAWGRRVAGGLGHNLTNDDLDYTDIERHWDERNAGELTALLKAGALVYQLRPQPGSVRYRICQGLSTLQANTQSWNPTTDDTPLLMQRDLADFIMTDIQAALDAQQVGANEVTASTVGATVKKRLDLHEKRGRIIRGSGRIASISLNDTGTGFDVVPAFRLPVTADYITVENRIQRA